MSTGIPRLLSRNTVSARGGITRQTIHAPGVGGMVTDVPSWQLRVSPTCQVPNAQDIIFPAGVATVRGAPTLVNGAVPTGMIGSIYGILYDSNKNVFNVSDKAATINNNLGTVAYTFAGGQGNFIPFVQWGDEVLWFCQDGVSPVVRTISVAFGTPYSSTNVLTFSANSTAVTVATGGFTAHNNGGWYTQWSVAAADDGTYTPYTSRIRTVASDTSATIDFPPPVTTAFAHSNMQPIGFIGLGTTVSDMGTASATTGTVTGQGTQWNTSGVGYGKPQRGDIFTYQGANTLWGVVASVPSATGFTTNASVTGATTLPYTIRRSLVGTHGCVYNNRLWVVGCAWQRRRLYYSPLTSSTEIFGSPATQGPIAPWTLGDPTNGYYSGTTNPGDANECPWIDVPDKNTTGKLVATAPTQSGLLILATDGAYMLHGDPPSESVRLLAAGADCMSNQSVVVSHNSVFWVGLNGIFTCTGGRVSDLTEHGGRSAEWQELAEAVTAGGANQSVVSWCVANHLIICASAGSGSNNTWVYDLHRQVWCGNHTTPLSTASWSSVDTNVAYVGTYVGGNKIYDMSEVYDDDGAGDPTANPIIDLPLSSCGIDISEQRRVIENKVTFELVGTSSQFGVLSAMDNAALSLDGSFTPVSGISTQRILPNTLATGGLGKVGNSCSIRLSANGTNSATTWRVHMVNLQVRNWPGRVT